MVSSREVCSLLKTDCGAFPLRSMKEILPYDFLAGLRQYVIAVRRSLYDRLLRSNYIDSFSFRPFPGISDFHGGMHNFETKRVS